MLKVANKHLFVLKKCFSTDMIQDFYNRNRYWHFTRHGSNWKKSKSGRGQLPSQSQYNNCNLSSTGKNHDCENNSNENFEFSLVTYNLLSQDLLKGHDYLYQGCHPDSLNWPSRKDKLARELKHSKPDIICLQEVNSFHEKKFYKPLLTNLGYAGLYKKRTGDKQDGCALYYKKSTFTLLNFLEIEFCRQDLTHLLNRDNVAIIGVLQPAQFGESLPRRLVVGTTHLLYNPNRGDVKLAQIRLLLAEMDRIVNSFSPAEQEKCSVILCGDMNAEPNSPFYKFITEGYLNTKGYLRGDISGQAPGRGPYCRPSDLNLVGINRSTQFVTPNSDLSNCDTNQNGSLKKRRKNYVTREDFLKDPKSTKDGPEDSPVIKHNFNFASVYPAQDRNNLPLVTTHHSMASCMVDYIFYRKSRSFKLLGYRTLLNGEQMGKIGPLPNHFLGSDHLSLHAKFLIES